MQDDVVDQALSELAAELDVRPSPAFGANVRVAVDASRASGRRWVWIGAATACGAAVIAAAMGVRPRPSVAEPPLAASVHETARPAGLAGPAPKTDTVPSASLRVRLRAVRRTAGPEVLVPVGQLEALRDFATLLRQGSLDASALPPQFIVPDKPDKEDGVPWRHSV